MTFVVNRKMDLDVESLTDAAYGERSADRCSIAKTGILTGASRTLLALIGKGPTRPSRPARQDRERK
jgi:hypothetical protein